MMGRVEKMKISKKKSQKTHEKKSEISFFIHFKQGLNAP